MEAEKKRILLRKEGDQLDSLIEVQWDSGTSITIIEDQIKSKFGIKDTQLMRLFDPNNSLVILSDTIPNNSILTVHFSMNQGQTSLNQQQQKQMDEMRLNQQSKNNQISSNQIDRILQPLFNEKISHSKNLVAELVTYIEFYDLEKFLFRANKYSREYLIRNLQLIKNVIQINIIKPLNINIDGTEKLIHAHQQFIKLQNQIKAKSIDERIMKLTLIADYYNQGFSFFQVLKVFKSKEPKIQIKFDKVQIKFYRPEQKNENSNQDDFFIFLEDHIVRHLDIPHNSKITKNIETIVSKVLELTISLDFEIDFNQFPNLRKINFRCGKNYDALNSLTFIQPRIKPELMKKLEIEFLSSYLNIKVESKGSIDYNNTPKKLLITHYYKSNLSNTIMLMDILQNILQLQKIEFTIKEGRDLDDLQKLSINCKEVELTIDKQPNIIIEQREENKNSKTDKLEINCIKSTNVELIKQIFNIFPNIKELVYRGDHVTHDQNIDIISLQQLKLFKNIFYYSILPLVHPNLENIIELECSKKYAIKLVNRNLIKPEQLLSLKIAIKYENENIMGIQNILKRMINLRSLELEIDETKLEKNVDLQYFMPSMKNLRKLMLCATSTEASEDCIIQSIYHFDQIIEQNLNFEQLEIYIYSDEDLKEFNKNLFSQVKKLADKLPRREKILRIIFELTIDLDLAIEYNRLNSEYSHKLEIQTPCVDMDETYDMSTEFKTLFQKNGSVTFEERLPSSQFLKKQQFKKWMDAPDNEL